VLCCCSNPIVLTKPDSADQTGKQRFNYLFYIDFVGALSDPVCQNALRHLQVRLAAWRMHAAVGYAAMPAGDVWWLSSTLHVAAARSPVRSDD
jgi:hypothetical protein